MHFEKRTEKVLKRVNYTKYLVALPSDDVPNAQNRALKKRKLDSNPRYGLDYISLCYYDIHKKRPYNEIL